MSEKLSALQVLLQRRNRLKRIAKRRYNYLLNLFSDITRGPVPKVNISATAAKDMPLQPGDTVRVRSKDEIRATLDRWNQLKKCSFMEEMWVYCGTTQRVFKRVRKFLDERDYLVKKCKGIVALDGVFCEGTKDFGPCDRSCYFFWREEWLEKTHNQED